MAQNSGAKNSESGTETASIKKIGAMESERSAGSTQGKRSSAKDKERGALGMIETEPKADAAYVIRQELLSF
jgi:hypothetical protein